MSPNAGQLHLVLPGLLGPLPTLTEGGAEAPSPAALETLLSRAERSDCPGDDPESTLFPLFGLNAPEGPDWPSAAVCRHSKGETTDDGYWLHADPVLLRPDMERVLLFSADALAIDAVEAKSLVELLSGHFSSDGWHLELVSPDHWLLRVQHPPAIATDPVHRVAGLSLSPFLPRGDDAVRWNALLNEAQMLLFDSEVNRRRRDAGRPEINGLWLWGGGRLPATHWHPWKRLVADQPLARGLGRLSGARVDALCTGLPSGAGDMLVYRDELFAAVVGADPIEWRRRRQALAPWFDALLDGLRTRRWSRLLLYPCNGHSYVLKSNDLHRFWRRVRPLAYFMD